MRMLTGGWVAVALLIPAGLVRGQEEPVAVRPVYTPRLDTVSAAAPADTLLAAPAAPPNCWRAQPRPPCDGFFLTELGVEVPLMSTTHADRTGVGQGGSGGGRRHADFQTRMVWSFGFMGTRGDHSHGGAFSLTSDGAANADFIQAIEYRYRNWRSRSAAVDLSIGFRRTDVWQGGASLVGARGITMMVAYTPARWLGVSLRADYVRAGGRSHRALLAGVQSARLSEVMLKYALVESIRAMLGAVGIELDEDCCES